MPNQFGDVNAAARFREIIRNIVRDVIAKERPIDRYATVVSVDPGNNRVTVQLAGESTTFVVGGGGVRPLAGATVRIGGPQGAPRITGIVSGADVVPASGGVFTGTVQFEETIGNVETGEIETGKLHIDHQEDVSGAGTGSLIVGRGPAATATSAHMAIDENEIQAYGSSGAAGTLNLNIESGGLVSTGSGGISTAGTVRSANGSQNNVAVGPDDGYGLYSDASTYTALSAGDAWRFAVYSDGTAIINADAEVRGDLEVRGPDASTPGLLKFRDSGGGNDISNLMIDLYGGTYGFGVSSSTLRYQSGGNHYFYDDSNLQMLIRSEGNAERLRLYGSSNNVDDAQISFYRGDNSSSKSGWVGFSSGNLYFKNDGVSKYNIYDAYFGHKFRDNGTDTFYIGNGDVTPHGGLEGIGIFGPVAGENIAVDANEIMWRNNGSRRRSDYSSSITTSSAQFQLYVSGHPTTEATKTLALDVSATDLLVPGVYANYSAGGGYNVAVAGGGGSIYRNSSSRRMKKNIEPITLAEARQSLNIEWVFYTPIEYDDHTERTAGAIAEQVFEDVDERFVQVDEEGVVQGLDYGRFTVMIGKLQQDHDQRIEVLEAENADLRSRLDTLEARLTAAGV